MTDTSALQEAVNYIVENLSSTRFFEIMDKTSGLAVGLQLQHIVTVVEPEEGVTYLHLTNGMTISVDRGEFLAMMAFAGGLYHKLNPKKDVVVEETVSE